MRIKLVGINARYTHSCLALFYLRNELEKKLAGVETEICQYTINDPYFTLIQRLTEPPAEYVFFSALIWNSELIEYLVDDLLSINDTCSIVIGGPQADVVGAKFTDRRRVSVFAGDIEAASEDFFNDLTTKSLRKRYQSSFLSASGRALGYPYRSADFDDHLQNRYVYYESSRGCPFFCTYCLSSAEKGIFHKSLVQVFDELEDILSHKPKTVRFVDRTFNDNPHRALQIWQFIKEVGGETLFHFEIAPDRFPVELLDFLDTVKPGLFQFEIGIQSTNPETLKAIQRPIDPIPAAEVIRRLRSMENIHLHVDLILGLPEETSDSFCRSINDVFQMEPHYIQMGLLKLLPGTAINDQAQKFGFKASSKPPYSVFANHWMNQQRLKEFYWLGECIELCVNNRYFVSLWHYLVTRGEDMAAFFSEMAQFFFDQGYFWKAATQQTLCRLLLEKSEERDDFQLIRELICFDWLRCGHRFLPEQLCYQQPTIDELKKRLYDELPEELPGVFSGQSRKTFLKRSIFHYFSNRAMGQLGYQCSTENELVCFCSERENRVHRFNIVKILSITD